MFFTPVEGGSAAIITHIVPRSMADHVEVGDVPVIESVVWWNKMPYHQFHFACITCMNLRAPFVFGVLRNTNQFCLTLLI